MAPGAHPHVGAPLRRNPFLKRLLALYLCVWGVAAIAPKDRETWLLENLLVVALVGLLALTHRRFVFSNLSYALITAFLLLHVPGSHYTYSGVPFAEQIGGALGFERNHYDRLVHFAFGLLLAYPLRELVIRVAHVHGAWSYTAPVVLILALSSAYEILESWAAQIVDPAIGMAFVGAQGDVWDGQKDMTLALTGAILAMAVAALRRRRTGREPYLGGADHATPSTSGAR